MCVTWQKSLEIIRHKCSPTVKPRDTTAEMTQSCFSENWWWRCCVWISTVKMFRGVAQEENWFEFNLASTVPASAQSILNLKTESQLRSLRLLCQIQRAGDCRCFWGEFTAKKMWENKGENTEYSWRRFDLFHIPDSLFSLVLYYQYYILELYY